MKKTSKKILLLAVVFTMLVTMFAFSASATSKSADEAIAWARSQLNNKVGSGECVALINAYYSYLGVSPVTGDARDYTRNSLPNGWQRLQGVQPQKGDILVYTDSGYGHVAIYENDYSHYHQNFSYDKWVKQITYHYKNEIYSTYWGVIRPNFNGSSSSWKTSAPVLDFGDNFYARITNLHSGMALGLNGSDVCLKNRANANDQIWLFVKVGNNRYKILNHSNGKALDVYDASGASGANLHVYTDNGSVAQKWGIFGDKANCVLSADCTDCVIDIWDDKYTEGNDVNMHTKHDGKNQRFKVEKIAAPAKPVVTVAASDKNTAFSWGKDAEAVSYSLTVKKDGAAYKTVNDITANTYTMELPNGSYTVTVTAKNFMSNTTVSDAKSFTVNNNSTENDNWTYAKTLPSGITSDKYEIEYKHTYSQVSKTSPGTDWVKGGVAKTDYVNKGDQYSSTLPLETSKTRVLSYTYYYHFCNASKGANFAETSSYPHFDSISGDNVYEAASAVDGDDNRYTYYHLKYKSDNSDAYCKSGVTCDGAYGSHDNRTYLWYKMYVYQDKEAINYYTYTKQEGWTDKKDSSADSYEVRYRLSEEKDPCADGHTYTSKTTKAATCTATGKKTYTCSVCKYKKTKTISKLGHKYSSSYTVDKKATCTAEGSKSKHCTRSGCSAKKSVTAIEKLAHTEVVVKGKKATCKATGLTDGKKCSVCGTVTVARKKIAKKSHTLVTVKGKAATCTATGISNGKKCKVCGTVTVEQKKVAKKAHSYKETVTKATLKKNGKSTKKCTVCGKVTKATIYRPKKIAIAATSYDCTGKAITPAVTVTDYNGKKLKKNTDYTVKYASGRKLPGKYKVTVTFKGKYTGTKNLYFTITPTASSKLTATASTSSVTLEWTGARGVTAYKIYKKVNGEWKAIDKTNTRYYTVKKLKPGTKYSFAVRPYYDDGKNVILAKKYTSVTVTTDSQVPTLKVTSTKKGTANLSWSKISGVNGYDIYMSTKKNGEYSYVETLFDAEVSKFTVKNLKSGKTYYFKVRSFTFTDDFQYDNHEFSAPKSVKIK